MVGNKKVMTLAEEEAEMLAELKAISQRCSDDRFSLLERKVVQCDKDDDGYASTFLMKNPEDPTTNQYWYSKPTIDALAGECASLIETRIFSGDTEFKVAFLSTPSLYFALPPSLRKCCFVFDYDRKWENDKGFVFYDFNSPTTFTGQDLESKFDMVVIDPPFITREVWEKYAETSKFLLKEEPKAGNLSGLFLGTTVVENASMIEELLGGLPTAFQPNIPNLVYQYNSYANFGDLQWLCKSNDEIL